MKTKNIILRLLVSMVCLLPQTLLADDYISGYIGDTFTLSVFDTYGLQACSWSCSNQYNVSFVSGARGTSATFKINKYFLGSVTISVKCTYRIGYGLDGYTYVNYEHFYVSCRSVGIAISPTQLTMRPGETYQLNYTQWDTHPSIQVSWGVTPDGIVKVSDSGLVTALAPGSCAVIVGNNYNARDYCVVTVEQLDPTAISLPATSQAILESGGTQLTPTFEPANAYSPVTWESSNTDVATVSQKGYVTPVSPGTAVITATTENGLSCSTTVTVSEPPFEVSEMLPANNATNISAFATPQITYSLDLFQGPAFESICLTSGGQTIEGTAGIDGKNLMFTPAHPLLENTDYTLTIPANALVNKWGTGCPTAATQHFRTGPYEKLSLAISIHGGYVMAGQTVQFSTDFESAEIRYTTDGTTPTQQSQLYTGAIVLYQDTQLRARAFKEGYTPSDVVAEDFIMSDMEITKMFPVNEQIYIYKHINPSIEYSSNISESSNINNVLLLKDNVKAMECEVVINGNTMCVVPKEQFETGHSYTIRIPENALHNNKGEPNKATEWSFTTGNAVTCISAGLDLFAARKADGSLWTWGNVLNSSDDDTGLCTYQQKNEPASFTTGIDNMSIGLTHYSMLSPEGKLSMWGRQYCGEFGNGNSESATMPVEVMDNVTAASNGGQTTAILKGEELYMCGRNDYGQIGDGTTDATNVPVKVLDNTIKCVAGYGSTYAIKSDGTLWAWGRNEHGELGDGTTEERHEPINIMSGVKDIAAARIGGFGAAVLKDDGTLWTLGETPEQIMSDVKMMSVGADFMAAVKNDGTLWTWGANEAGQLGDGSFSLHDTPVQIMDGIDCVDCSYKSAIALGQDGSVYTWGKMPGGVSSRPERRVEGVAHTTLQGLTTSSEELKLDVGKRAVVQILPDPLNAEFTAWDWQTSNAKVATVDEHGMVEAKSKGLAIVTLTSDNGISASCRILVGNAAYGDANGDGRIDIEDYNIVVNYIARKNPSGFNFNNADVNEDGVIDINDLTNIVNIITQK